MARTGPHRILDAPGIERALSRIAEEVLERNPGGKALALIGVRTRGVPLARRLSARIGEMEKTAPPVGVLDITLYRDDFSDVGSQPIVRKSEMPFAVTGKRIVLVDDVLFTGRTVRAALDGLVDFGRPRLIQLAALVDRGHRELPIHADYVGKTVSTTLDEFVQVRLKEEDGVDEVIVGEMPKGAPRGASRRRPA